MIRYQIKASHGLAFLIASILPILTVVLCLAVMSTGSADKPQGEPVNPGDAAGGSPGLIGVIFMFITALLVFAKLAALFGIWRRWYFTWVFHALEVQLTTFLVGLFAVISAFSIDFSFIGLFKLLLIFVFLYLNILLYQFWSAKPAKLRFDVSRYSRAHHSTEPR